MKNEHLAEWLQDHTEMFSLPKNEIDNAFYMALYETAIEMAIRGKTDMLDPVLESVATYAVAIEHSLTEILAVPQQLQASIWQRIGEEIDPEPAFNLLSDVNLIFSHITQIIITAYLKAIKQSHAAHTAETSRLYAESEQKALTYAAEMTRANRELSKLEQAKTDFISIAAHELKTPLTIIQGYVNMLLSMNTEEETSFLTNGIYKGTERMVTIIDDMLDLSAIDMNQLSLSLEPVNIKALINLIVSKFNHTLIERKQTIDIVDLDNLPLVEADNHRLHQIFKQIISNAIKYTPDGGCIIISGEETWQGQVKIIVKDTGVGVAPEELENIFRKFHRVGSSDLHSTSKTKFMGAGPGLGLAVARGIAKAHGGDIWVDSQGFDMQNLPGSAFNILIPIKATPQEGVQTKWIYDTDTPEEENNETEDNNE